MLSHREPTLSHTFSTLHGALMSMMAERGSMRAQRALPLIFATLVRIGYALATKLFAKLATFPMNFSYDSYRISEKSVRGALFL